MVTVRRIRLFGRAARRRRAAPTATATATRTATAATNGTATGGTGGTATGATTAATGAAAATTTEAAATTTSITTTSAAMARCVYLWLIQPASPDAGVPAVTGVSADRRSAEDTVFGLLRRSEAQVALLIEARFVPAAWPASYLPTGRRWLAIRNAETTAWMIALPVSRRRP